MNEKWRVSSISKSKCYSIGMEIRDHPKGTDAEDILDQENKLSLSGSGSNSGSEGLYEGCSQYEPSKKQEAAVSKGKEKKKKKTKRKKNA